MLSGGAGLDEQEGGEWNTVAQEHVWNVLQCKVLLLDGPEDDSWLGAVHVSVNTGKRTASVAEQSWCSKRQTYLHHQFSLFHACFRIALNQ